MRKKFASFCQVLKRCTQKKIIVPLFLPHGVLYCMMCKDPILRWAGALSLAAAYAGTGNNGAVRRLLHMAVSDVADDVRRAAVAAIGFILFRSPEQCPTVVSLLAESYNPHVRSDLLNVRRH